MKHIDIAEAKMQLHRISDALEVPLLLIGGLAVNQYVVTRNSQDIDLICDYETARNLVRELYPTTLWTHSELNQDEYRPSFHLKHKHESKYPVIKIGPKITERGAYRFLDWDALGDEAVPFSYKKNTLSKILVPSVEALCYTKLISFLGRSIENTEKLRQDLSDIRELTNKDSFRLGPFLNLIHKNKLDAELDSSFIKRISDLNDSIEDSNLGILVKLFSKAIYRTTNNIRSGHNNVIRPPVLIAEEKSKIRLAAFDLDGTLIKGIRHSWTLVWKVLGSGNTDQKERKERFCNGELSYLEWCRLDGDDFIKRGLTKSHFAKIARSGICSLTKNAREAITKLRESGVKTAIISGGIDALLYALIPDADDLFDEILINQFVFSEDGMLKSISATEYDWDDNRVGVVGKQRGLERICEKYQISINDAAFIGDDLNDFEAMRIAGLKVFYCGDNREFKGEHLPTGIAFIPDNDLMKVADRILNPPTGEQIE